MLTSLWTIHLWASGNSKVSHRRGNFVKGLAVDATPSALQHMTTWCCRRYGHMGGGEGGKAGLHEERTLAR